MQDVSSDDCGVYVRGCDWSQKSHSKFNFSSTLVQLPKTSHPQERVPKTCQGDYEGDEDEEDNDSHHDIKNFYGRLPECQALSFMFYVAGLLSSV